MRAGRPSSVRAVDAAALRLQFPVLARVAYLNAGTCGPLPRASLEAARDVWELAESQGRGAAYFERLGAMRERLRAAYASVLGADPLDVALTTSTSEGVVRVLAGLELGPGDEVLTAPDEHAGLLGPLRALRERRSVAVRTAPLAELPDAVGPRTALVACSHVSWTTGALAPEALAGLDVPLLLDGAQSTGAVPIDLSALGCSFYAGSGQKWLCGPMGSGMLWVSPAWRERLEPTGLTYVNLSDPAAGLAARPLPGAARHDAPALALETVAPALAAYETLASAGLSAVQRRATGLAARLAELLAGSGRLIAPRGRSTLVSWHSRDPVLERDRLAAAGVVVRDLPGTPLLRASTGAWNDESDLERLLAAL